MSIVANQIGSFGQLLKRWRSDRGKSQLALALDARVSPRHISFVESGRSTPSREMVVTLATALNVPLRERNTLLVAAGYAPIYHETDPATPELEFVRKALDLILNQQEPYPAVVMNRHWDIAATNKAAQRFFSFLMGDGNPQLMNPPNVIRLMFHPEGIRQYVTNWNSVAAALIQRIHREAVGGIKDQRTIELLEEVLAYPGVSNQLSTADPAFPLEPIIPVHFHKDRISMQFFSTVTVLGTPQDITLQELRIECFFPANLETEMEAKRFAASAP